MKSKKIDGGVVDIASALNFVKSGDGRILTRFGHIVKDFHLHVMFATDKAIAAKPEAIRAFIARLVRNDRVHAQEQGEDRRDRRTR